MSDSLKERWIKSVESYRVHRPVVFQGVQMPMRTHPLIIKSMDAFAQAQRENKLHPKLPTQPQLTRPALVQLVPQQQVGSLYKYYFVSFAKWASKSGFLPSIFAHDHKNGFGGLLSLVKKFLEFTEKKLSLGGKN